MSLNSDPVHDTLHIQLAGPFNTLHLQCGNSHSLWTLPPGRGSTQGYIFSSRNGSLKSWQQMDKDLSIPSQDCFGLHLCCLRYDPSQSLNYLGAVPTSGVRMEPRCICFCSHYDFVLHKKKKEREKTFSLHKTCISLSEAFLD